MADVILHHSESIYRLTYSRLLVDLLSGKTTDEPVMVFLYGLYTYLLCILYVCRRSTDYLLLNPSIAHSYTFVRLILHTEVKSRNSPDIWILVVIKDI